MYSHKFTLLDYSKESIHGIPGTKIISNFLTKPGLHMVNINRYIFGHELGPAVCYIYIYVIMNLMHLASQISIQMAYYLTLTTHIQVASPYWMIWCQLGQNPGK